MAGQGSEIITGGPDGNFLMVENGKNAELMLIHK